MAKKPQTTKTRRLKQTSYKSFKLQKRVKHETGELPSIYQISKKTIRLIRSRWRLFGGMVLIYVLLNAMIVGGLSLGGNIQDLKDQAQLDGQNSTFSNSLSVFGSLVSGGSSASSNPSGGTYQFILIVIFSLAFMWALRQVQANEKIGLRQTFYQGMYPLIPFFIVLIVVFLQLLPMLAGNFVYAIAVNGGIAIEVVERFIWGIFSGLLILLSLYMVSSSVFALYITTLPNMTPLQALRSAREIVRYRRFAVMRKILALPIVLVVSLGLIIVPLIIIAPTLAQVVAYILGSAILLVTHGYLYTLYRELL